jgi:hypothetical protein
VGIIRNAQSKVFKFQKRFIPLTIIPLTLPAFPLLHRLDCGASRAGEHAGFETRDTADLEVCATARCCLSRRLAVAFLQLVCGGLPLLTETRERLFNEALPFCLPPC